MQDVNPDTRRALINEARSQDVSINEVVVRILCAAYKVKHTPFVNGLRGHEGSPLKFTEVDETTKDLCIRGGAKLHRKISDDARKRGGTLRGVVLERLNLHFSLPTEPIGRRPRTKEMTA